MFSCEFCKIFKNTYFAEYLWTPAFTNWLYCNSKSLFLSGLNTEFILLK